MKKWRYCEQIQSDLVQTFFISFDKHWTFYNWWFISWLHTELACPFWIVILDVDMTSSKQYSSPISNQKLSKLLFLPKRSWLPLTKTPVIQAPSSLVASNSKTSFAISIRDERTRILFGNMFANMFLFSNKNRTRTRKTINTLFCLKSGVLKIGNFGKFCHFSDYAIS